MKIEVFITPDRVTDDMLRGCNAAVIDILRASTTISMALACGCREVLPRGSMEDAATLAHQLDRKQVVVCGERGGQKIAGYDLGNSPRDYTTEKVGDKSIIFTSTNGSRAMVRSAKSLSTAIVSFLNISAVATWFARQGKDIVIICSGRENQFSLEDTVCAGMLVDKISQQVSGVALNDAARMACILNKRYEHSLEEMLRESDHGQYLETVGFSDDIPFCAQIDTLTSVPLLREGRITL